MAADGLYDGDALDDLSQHIGRAGSRLDRLDPGRLDREQVYLDLRAQVGAGDPGSGSGQTEDGGWSWHGLDLDPAANRIADEALAIRRAAEGRDDAGNYAKTGITPVMRQIEAGLDHGTLVPDTERFAVKSADRFKEKLAKLIDRYPDRAAGDLAAAIHDGIRYTFLFPAEHYAAGTAEATRLLNDRGYRELSPADCCDGAARFAAGAVRFEVQFRTPQDWEARQRTHDLYQKLCDVRTGPQERSRLDRELNGPGKGTTYFAVSVPQEPAGQEPAGPDTPAVAAGQQAPAVAAAEHDAPAVAAGQHEPAGVARRRVLADGGLADEMLRPDLSWQPDTVIAEWKRGDAIEALAEISEEQAQALIERSVPDDIKLGRA